MKEEIKGTFEIEMEALSFLENEPLLGRRSLVKKYLGPLSGQGKGQMLSAQTGTKGSAGYVAIEKFEGKVNNLSGSFVLQHFGVMEGGNSHLDIQVVPDSGTEDLKGISGKMSIEIKEGKHYYTFEFEQ